jgi:rsbT antagonist protein RsbS
MDKGPVVTEFGIHVVNDCLIVPIGDNLDEDALQKIGKEILTCLETTDTKGVLINVSAVTILGSYGFSILRNTARGIAMMGARAIFVGFQPGVASSLVDLDMDFNGLLTAITSEAAFELLAQQNSNLKQADGFDGKNRSFI